MVWSDETPYVYSFLLIMGKERRWCWPENLCERVPVSSAKQTKYIVHSAV